MTEESIRWRIAQIELARGDDEVAHHMEDALYQDLLRHIAENPGVDFSGFAALALTVMEMKFARWCA